MLTTAVLLCESFGAVSGRCHVQQREIFPMQEMHTEITVQVKFPCRGHQLGLVLASDEAQVTLPYGDSTLTIKGYGPFRFADVDPEKTYRATIQGDCQPMIVSLDAQPSLETLRVWNEQANGQARVLGARLDSYRRARDLHHVVLWDDEQLRATKQRVTELLVGVLPAELRYEELITADGHLKDASAMPPLWAVTVSQHPEIPDLVALRAQVESIVAGRPPVYDASHVDTEGESLKAEIARAKAILSRAEPWLGRMNEESRFALERLKQLIQGGPQ